MNRDDKFVKITLITCRPKFTIMKIIYLALFASLFIVNSPIFFNNLAGIYAQSENDDTIPIKTSLLYTSDNGNLTSFRMLDTNEPIKTEVSFIEKAS